MLKKIFTLVLVFIFTLVNGCFPTNKNTVNTNNKIIENQKENKSFGTKADTSVVIPTKKVQNSLPKIIKKSKDLPILRSKKHTFPQNKALDFQGLNYKPIVRETLFHKALTPAEIKAKRKEALQAFIKLEREKYKKLRQELRAKQKQDLLMEMQSFKEMLKFFEKGSPEYLELIQEQIAEREKLIAQFKDDRKALKAQYQKELVEFKNLLNNVLPTPTPKPQNTFNTKFLGINDCGNFQGFCDWWDTTIEGKTSNKPPETTDYEYSLESYLTNAYLPKDYDNDEEVPDTDQEKPAELGDMPDPENEALWQEVKKMNLPDLPSCRGPIIGLTNHLNPNGVTIIDLGLSVSNCSPVDNIVIKGKSTDPAYCNDIFSYEMKLSGAYSVSFQPPDEAQAPGNYELNVTFNMTNGKSYSQVLTYEILAKNADLSNKLKVNFLDMIKNIDDPFSNPSPTTISSNNIGFHIINKTGQYLDVKLLDSQNNAVFWGKCLSISEGDIIFDKTKIPTGQYRLLTYLSTNQSVSREYIFNVVNNPIKAWVFSRKSLGDNFFSVNSSINTSTFEINNFSNNPNIQLPNSLFSETIPKLPTIDSENCTRDSLVNLYKTLFTNNNNILINKSIFKELSFVLNKDSTNNIFDSNTSVSCLPEKRDRDNPNSTSILGIVIDTTFTTNKNLEVDAEVLLKNEKGDLFLPVNYDLGSNSKKVISNNTFKIHLGTIDYFAFVFKDSYYDNPSVFTLPEGKYTVEIALKPPYQGVFQNSFAYKDKTFLSLKNKSIIDIRYNDSCYNNDCIKPNNFLCNSLPFLCSCLETNTIPYTKSDTTVTQNNTISINPILNPTPSPIPTPVPIPSSQNQISTPDENCKAHLDKLAIAIDNVSISTTLATNALSTAIDFNKNIDIKNSSLNLLQNTFSIKGTIDTTAQNIFDTAIRELNRTSIKLNEQSNYFEIAKGKIDQYILGENVAVNNTQITSTTNITDLINKLNTDFQNKKTNGNITEGFAILSDEVNLYKTLLDKMLNRTFVSDSQTVSQLKTLSINIGTQNDTLRQNVQNQNNNACTNILIYEFPIISTNEAEDNKFISEVTNTFKLAHDYAISQTFKTASFGNSPNINTYLSYFKIKANKNIQQPSKVFEHGIGQVVPMKHLVIAENLSKFTETGTISGELTIQQEGIAFNKTVASRGFTRSVTLAPAEISDIIIQGGDTLRWFGRDEKTTSYIPIDINSSPVLGPYLADVGNYACIVNRNATQVTPYFHYVDRGFVNYNESHFKVVSKYSDYVNNGVPKEPRMDHIKERHKIDYLSEKQAIDFENLFLAFAEKAKEICSRRTTDASKDKALLIEYNTMRGKMVNDNGGYNTTRNPIIPKSENCFELGTSNDTIYKWVKSIANLEFNSDIWYESNSTWSKFLTGNADPKAVIKGTRDGVTIFTRLDNPTYGGLGTISTAFPDKNTNLTGEQKKEKVIRYYIDLISDGNFEITQEYLKNYTPHTSKLRGLLNK
ncbi:MAG: hypothetical protein U0457_18665 [Candidatus Sericytochromatia bacterium]